MRTFLQSVSHWLPLFLFADLCFIFMTALLRPGALLPLSGFISLFSLLILVLGYRLDRSRQRRWRRSLERLIEDPTESHLKDCRKQLARGPLTSVPEAVYKKLSDQNAQIRSSEHNLQNYQDFIAGWTHQIKTPLSLIPMLLSNYGDTLTDPVKQRLDYVHRGITEQVDKMLYYARLQTDHVDFKFEWLRLDAVVQDLLADFAPLLLSRAVDIRLDLPPLPVLSDRKILAFMLSQILSNAVKYADPADPVIRISGGRENGSSGTLKGGIDRNAAARDTAAGRTVWLDIRDNGSGVPPEDAPFIFEKGFTGFGLYLVRKYAEALALEIRLLPGSTGGNGFGLRILFPAVMGGDPPADAAPAADGATGYPP